MAGLEKFPLVQEALLAFKDNWCGRIMIFEDLLMNFVEQAGMLTQIQRSPLRGLKQLEDILPQVEPWNDNRSVFSSLLGQQRHHLI